MKHGIYTLILDSHLKGLREFRESLSSNYLFEFGWGNGYVLLPSNHPFYGKDYEVIDVDIHGGLTFGKTFDSGHFLEWIKGREVLGDVTRENYNKFDGYWIIGFDTNHFNDNMIKCTKDYVISETDSLLEQCLDDNIKGIKKYKYIYLRKDKLKSIGSLNIDASVLALSSKQETYNGAKM